MQLYSKGYNKGRENNRRPLNANTLIFFPVPIWCLDWRYAYNYK